jgi:hypothetical protein
MSAVNGLFAVADMPSIPGVSRFLASACSFVGFLAVSLSLIPAVFSIPGFSAVAEVPAVGELLAIAGAKPLFLNRRKIKQNFTF